MSRKKVSQEDLFEDEKRIPPEENNCFGFKDNKCEVCAANKMTQKDKINCGTVRCVFYKPKEHENSIKHIAEDGSISFESFEDFRRKTGIRLLKRDEFEEYLGYPHAENEITNESFFEYVRKERCFGKLSTPDLKSYAQYIGVPVDGLDKKDMVSLLESFK